MTTILGFDTHDVRFPTSRHLDGSDAMNPNPDYSAAYLVLRTDAADGLAVDAGEQRQARVQRIPERFQRLVVGARRWIQLAAIFLERLVDQRQQRGQVSRGRIAQLDGSGAHGRSIVAPIRITRGSA